MAPASLRRIASLASMLAGFLKAKNRPIFRSSSPRKSSWSLIKRPRRLSVPKTPSIGFAIAGESEHNCWMFAIAFLFVRVLCDCFKSRRLLEAEVLVLRHQLNVLQQRAPRRLYLTWIDRALFVWLYRGYPRILDAITILRPETIVRWHRKGFAAFWRWKSRPLGGRPQVDKEVRDLIR